MQVNSSTGLSAQLQALETAALKQQQAASSGFAVPTPQTAGSSATTINATSGGQQLNSSFQMSSLVAVGTVGANGQVQLFSQDQIDGEYAAVAKMGQTAYANALQNFMTLSQQADTTGQPATSSYTDQASFVGDNGLISANFDSSFTLGPAGGGQTV
jgi:hypothetical protein